MDDDRKPATNPPDYLSFLLRLWRENGEIVAKALWRASLQDPATGEQVGFANLDALFSFLSEQTGKSEPKKEGQ